MRMKLVAGIFEWVEKITMEARCVLEWWKLCLMRSNAILIVVFRLMPYS